MFSSYLTHYSMLLFYLLQFLFIYMFLSIGKSHREKQDIWLIALNLALPVAFMLVLKGDQKHVWLHHLNALATHTEYKSLSEGIIATVGDTADLLDDRKFRRNRFRNLSRYYRRDSFIKHIKTEDFGQAMASTIKSHAHWQQHQYLPRYRAKTKRRRYFVVKDRADEYLDVDIRPQRFAKRVLNDTTWDYHRTRNKWRTFKHLQRKRLYLLRKYTSKRSLRKYSKTNYFWSDQRIKPELPSRRRRRHRFRYQDAEDFEHNFRFYKFFFFLKLKWLGYLVHADNSYVSFSDFLFLPEYEPEFDVDQYLSPPFIRPYEKWFQWWYLFDKYHLDSEFYTLMTVYNNVFSLLGYRKYRTIRPKRPPVYRYWGYSLTLGTQDFMYVLRETSIAFKLKNREKTFFKKPPASD